MARSRRTSAVLNLLKLLGAFRPPKPDQQDLLRYALDGHGYAFSFTAIIISQVCARSLNLGLIVLGSRPQAKTVAGRWLKSSEQHG
jgi:hypothetical protein